jgi:putative DNA methylase
MPYPKRLIEVDLPIKKISAHARREKSIRQGHISTLHIWWARRPLAACRAVLCASLWLDPADQNCPKKFIEDAKKEMIKWSDNDHLKLLSKESIEHFIKINHDKQLVNNKTFLRQLLLDFIADFANFDNSNHEEYLRTTKALTQSAHICWRRCNSN